MGLTLVGDIGGAHGRPAMGPVETGTVVAPPEPLRCSAYDSREDLPGAHLAGHPPAKRPTRAAMAAAGPVRDGAVSVSRAAVVNDIEALGECAGKPPAHGGGATVMTAVGAGGSMADAAVGRFGSIPGAGEG